MIPRRTRSYDAIVVGVGGMGSAACYHLARRGQRVLGLERYDIPHVLGSSHGFSRIIRLAYYENPAYVPLLRRAYELWRELERQAGEKLLHITGSIDASAPGGEIFEGSRRSCELHDLPHTILTGAELSRRFPGYRLPPDHLALLQPDGGFLSSERCIVAHATAAKAAGAEIRKGEQVIDWEPTAAGIRVRTSRGQYVGRRLVVCAGAWVGTLIPGLSTLARPERQVVCWFEPRVKEYFAPAVFPVFNLSVDEGRYYGYPEFAITGFKVGRYHHRGEQIASVDHWDRLPNAEDEALLREFTARYFPEGAGPLWTARSCLFTNTPDGHFVIDALPGEPRVIVASPCSGHGFKFCPVVGEIVADLAIEGSTRHDTRLFRLSRFH
jgi:sarcosine oxidase